MNKKILFAILILGLTVMTIQSCELNGCSRGDMASSITGKESMKMVGDCMNCHGPNGNGRGCFVVGGTVYDTTLTVKNPNAVIMFYTQPNGGGELMGTLDVDQSGNFYTTSVINFSSGLYPVIKSKVSSDVQYMPAPTITGACNSCHGMLNQRIWVN